MKKQNYKINYSYKNTTHDHVELWFSKPKEANTQQHITIDSNIEPEKITEYRFLNTIWYFNLKPNQKLNISIKYYGSHKDHRFPASITTEEKNFFLRSTKLIPVNEEIKKEAESIVGNAQTDMEKAKMIYLHLTKTYKYSTRFDERGVSHFINRGSGDCGEFAALFASYCRSLGIPTKVLYGTWALKKFSPHSWNEIFIDKEGWIPMDASMGRIKPYYHPLINISTSIYYGAFQNKNKYFGDHEGKRFAFSIEPERELAPAYQDATDYSDLVIKNCVDHKEIAWGFESFDGKAPFLQPIYPRIHSKEKKTSYPMLFGEWKGKHLQWYKNLTYQIKTVSFNFGFALLLMEVINEYIIRDMMLSTILPLLSSPLILLATIMSLIRKEGNVLIYTLGIIYIFAFIGVLATYLGID
ncbi:transglutaminase-like domain-containing protein [Lentibacillus saliphilus]|uniref:transglutaminase-like domain-containing protein n=1 Tax=Lentibacillus saliphilus TaxID=2737028 RepID=UPI001C306D91|nr:transglutaminase domain-containing protein [Lentibacillus saliphilus]